VGSGWVSLGKGGGGGACTCAWHDTALPNQPPNLRVQGKGLRAIRYRGDRGGVAGVAWCVISRAPGHPACASACK